MLDPYFCGFLFVALQQDIHRTKADWMDYKQALHCGTFDKKRQQPEDVWPLMSGHTVCVQKDLLYFHLEKNKTS